MLAAFEVRIPSAMLRGTRAASLYVQLSLEAILVIHHSKGFTVYRCFYYLAANGRENTAVDNGELRDRLRYIGIQISKIPCYGRRGCQNMPG